jgi:5-formyltetrahydrofolate cyclo-ligase
MISKKSARANLKSQIIQIPDRNSQNQKILFHLKHKIHKSQRIIAYRADEWEVDFFSWTQTENSIQFFFPKILSWETKKMEFVYPESWIQGKFGLWEPLGKEILSPHNADWILVPALGFQKDGFRLGRGGGFYDRAMAGVDPAKMIGLQYSEIFPCEFRVNEFDIRVGTILSENGVIFSGSE